MNCPKCKTELVQTRYHQFVNCYCEKCDHRFTYNEKRKLIYSRAEKELRYKKFTGRAR